MYARWIQQDSRFAFSEEDNGGVIFSDQEHAELLAAQCAGKIIRPDATWRPVAVDPPKPTAAQIWEQIKAMRDQRKAGGVKVKVGTVNKWFHSDVASRIQQMGLVMLGTSIPADLQWKTMDGSFVTMTQAVAGNVFAAVAASDQAIFAVAEGHRVAMEASAWAPAVYDYSTGWPAIFGE